MSDPLLPTPPHSQGNEVDYLRNIAASSYATSQKSAGGGGASAAKQDAQITAEQAILAALTGVVRTPAFTAATSSGTVAAGAKSVIFNFSPDFTGTILGTTVDLNAMGGIPFTAPSNDTLGAIIYTRSAGTLYITSIV